MASNNFDTRQPSQNPEDEPIGSESEYHSFDNDDYEETDENDGDFDPHRYSPIGSAFDLDLMEEDDEDEDEDEEEEEDEEEVEEEDDDDDDDDEILSNNLGHPHIIISRDVLIQTFGSRPYQINRANNWSSSSLPKLEPNEQGKILMRSGLFGIDSQRKSPYSKSKKISRKLLDRQLGLSSYGRETKDFNVAKHDMIPSSKAEFMIEHEERCYSGQFSHDGNFFFSCCQDMNVRIYDTSDPYNWKYYKKSHMPHSQWTITDASLSNDNKWLAYCSLTPIVYITPSDPLDDSLPRTLNIGKLASSRATTPSIQSYFNIYSVRFSSDGSELVVGSGGRQRTDYSIFVYDLERDESILKIPGHKNDVNAVCFGDVNSPHLLYSGSDDYTVKVWDRRSIADLRPSGVFSGHTSGVTFVDSKGDGRYVLSNSKDHTAKLWDLRKMRSDTSLNDEPEYVNSLFSSYYRNPPRARPNTKQLDDCSVVTFTGHRVERTLIRCHFSPSGSTDSRYVYSGSFDGKIYVWNMDATLKSVIDVESASRHLRERPAIESPWGEREFQTVVRDCSWHPDLPIITATSWNGFGGNYGTCSIHTWNDAGQGVDKEFDQFRTEIDPQNNEVEEKPQEEIKIYNPKLRAIPNPSRSNVNINISRMLRHAW